MYGSYKVNSDAKVSQNRIDRSFKNCLKVLTVIGVLFVAFVIVLLAILATAKNKSNSSESGLLSATTVRQFEEQKQNDPFEAEMFYNNKKQKNWNKNRPERYKNYVKDYQSTTEKEIDKKFDSVTTEKNKIYQKSEQFQVSMEDQQRSTEKEYEDTEQFQINQDIEKLDFKMLTTERNFIKIEDKTERNSILLEDKTERNYIKVEDKTDNPQTTENGNILKTTIKETMSTISPAFFQKPAKEPQVITKIIKKMTVIEKECPMICNSIDCKKSAAQIIQKLDFDIDPCEDFYKYSCQGLKNNQIKSLDPKQKFEETVSKYLKHDQRAETFLSAYKTFYKTCMDYKCDGTTDPVVKHFWPIFEIKDINNLSDNQIIAKFLSQAIKSNLNRSPSKLMPIFDLKFEFSDDGSTIPVISIITEPDLLQEAHSEDVYVRNCKAEMKKSSAIESNAGKLYDVYQNCLKNHTMYIKVLEKSISLFEFYKDGTEFEKEQHVKSTVTNVEWDILDLLGLLNQKEINDEMIKPLKVVQINDLVEMCPEIDWTLFFSNFIEAKPTNIGIRFMDKFKKMCEFYKKGYKDIKDSILAMIAHDFYVDFMMPTLIPERVNYCNKVSNALMEDVVANTYATNVDKQRLEQFETLSHALFKQLIQQLTANIEISSWLDIDEKGLIISKLDKLQLITNYSTIFGKSKTPEIAKRFEKIELDDKDFVKNIIILKKRKKELQVLPTKTETDRVFLDVISPIADKIEVKSDLNKIFIPLKVADEFINQGRKLSQNYENYATLGLKLGQAIISLFNPRQIKRILNEKPNEILQNFLTIRFVDPAILKIPNKFDMELSQNDLQFTNPSRFSDDGSLRLAWDTYKTFSPLSNDLPLFGLNESIPTTFHLISSQQFCSTATEKENFVFNLFESPDLDGYLRVNNMVMNSHHFAETFDCPVGSSMNPEFKSDQFPFIIDY